MFRFLIQKRDFFFPRYSAWVLLSFFLLAFFYFGFLDYATLRPRHPHIWRQTDCLTYALNYYQEDIPLLQPEMHFRAWDGTGKTVSEFTGLYWLVSKIWKITGYHEWIYRAFVMCFLFLACFSVLKLAETLLKESIWGLCIGLTLLTSPVLLFYGFNFLTDVPAFSLQLFALYSIVLYVKRWQTFWLLMAIVSFSLGGMLKITSVIPWCAFMAVLHLQKWRGTPFLNGKGFAALLLPLIPWLFWLGFARNYNSQFNDAIFLMSIKPVFGMAFLETKQVLLDIWSYWITEYWATAMRYFWIVAGLGIFFLFKFLPSWAKQGMVFLFLGGLAFILLFLKNLVNHDYYTINFMAIFPALFIFLVLGLYSWNSKLAGSFLLKGAFIVLLLFSFGTAKSKLKGRYLGWWNKDYIERELGFESITPKLREAGITRIDIFLVPHDITPNLCLYLMDQKGYSGFAGGLSSPEKYEGLIYQGAKFIALLDTSHFQEQNYYPFLNEALLQHEGILVYSLKQRN